MTSREPARTAAERSRPLLFFPISRVPSYEIRLGLWKIEAASSSEVKQKVCDMLRRTPETFSSIEEARQFNPNRPVWKRLRTWPGIILPAIA